MRLGVFPPRCRISRCAVPGNNSLHVSVASAGILLASVHVWPSSKSSATLKLKWCSSRIICAGHPRTSKMQPRLLGSHELVCHFVEKFMATCLHLNGFSRVIRRPIEHIRGKRCVISHLVYDDLRERLNESAPLPFDAKMCRPRVLTVMGLWPFSLGATGGRVPEFPLQLLQEAIETRDEGKVWKVLRKQRIRNELARSTTTHKVPNDPEQKKCNVFTCVETAVYCEMPRVVLAMYRFNPADIRLATWFVLHRLSKPNTKHSTLSNPKVKVAKELVDLAQAQRKAWLWDQIGTFMLLRYSDILQGKTRRSEELNHPVVNIPDEAFNLILSFVDLHEDREARILQFLIEARSCPICTRLCIPGKCKARRLRRMERRASKRLSGS